jgi:hypothetical protein
MVCTVCGGVSCRSSCSVLQSCRSLQLRSCTAGCGMSSCCCAGRADCTPATHDPALLPCCAAGHSIAAHLRADDSRPAACGSRAAGRAAAVTVRHELRQPDQGCQGQQVMCAVCTHLSIAPSASLLTPAAHGPVEGSSTAAAIRLQGTAQLCAAGVVRAGTCAASAAPVSAYDLLEDWGVLQVAEDGLVPHLGVSATLQQLKQYPCCLC